MKPKRRKRKVLPEPITITTMAGTMTLNDPADLFAQALKETEPEVIRTMAELIDMDLASCDAKNEMAKVSAATKVLDMLGDKATPAGLAEKLEPLRHPAVEALRNVVNDGGVQAARATAGAYLLKAIRIAAPSAWPPDTTTNEWNERMNKANSMCAV